MATIITSFGEDGKMVRKTIKSTNRDGTETTVTLDFTKNPDGEIVQLYTI